MIFWYNKMLSYIIMDEIKVQTINSAKLDELNKEELASLLRKCIMNPNILEEMRLEAVKRKNETAILVFDIETTGARINPSSQQKDDHSELMGSDIFADHPTFSDDRVVKLVCTLYNKAGELLEKYEWVLKPSNWLAMSQKVLRKHGITEAKAKAIGVEFQDIMQKFERLLSKTKILVVHDLNFAKHILAAECHIRGFQVIAKELMAKETYSTASHTSGRTSTCPFSMC